MKYFIRILFLSSIVFAQNVSSVLEERVNSEYLQITDEAEILFDSDSLAFDFWIKPNTLPGAFMQIFSKINTGASSDKPGVVVSINSADQLFIRIANGVTRTDATSTLTFNTNWQFMQIFIDKQIAAPTVKAWVDNVSFINVAVITGGIASLSDFFIGALGDLTGPPSGNFFDGHFDSFSMWKAIAYNQTQRYTDRQLKLTGSETGLVLYLLMDEGTGVTASDIAGTANDATLQAGASFSSTVPFSFYDGEAIEVFGVCKDP